MNVTLFDRAGKRLRITEQGNKLLSATQILESVIVRDVMNLTENPIAISGHVRIGTFEGFGAFILHEGFRSYCVTVPNLRSSLSLCREAIHSLLEKSISRLPWTGPPPAASVFKKLTPYALEVYGSKSYFPNHKRPENIEELKEHLWCGYIPDPLFTEELDFLTFDETIIMPRYRTTGPIVQMEAVCASTNRGPTVLRFGSSTLRRRCYEAGWRCCCSLETPLHDRNRIGMSAPVRLGDQYRVHILQHFLPW